VCGGLWGFLLVGVWGCVSLRRGGWLWGSGPGAPPPPPGGKKISLLM